ncbi:ArsR/SmtB family transcription factor [Rhodococcus opacus]|uniref:ArsR/SmtB family transcription factor n=1 Tax=Rhodococcus opacus TaxID=37919 RepID=UPI00223687F9|nr:metalloregulator ArsR/SmtB family transcription factor [Rhodococcus opacus]
MPVLGGRGRAGSAARNPRDSIKTCKTCCAQLQELRARVCKAIADPKRLIIINELRDRELSVGELCEATGISQSNASQHLTILASEAS